VVIEDSGATDTFVPQAETIGRMVQSGLTNLTGLPTPEQAWLSLITTQDVIGLKVYSSPGPNIGTRVSVVKGVVESLLQTGIPARQIIIWDRFYADLRLAGFSSLTNLGVRLEGVVSGEYDESVYYENPLIGQLVYSDMEFGRKGEGVGRKSFVSKLVTTEITKMVLVSPLLNHNRAGTCGHLYSLASGSVDNFFRFETRSNRLAVAVPEICALPELGDRVVLCITDALICQYQGEKRGLLHYSTALNELRFSKDPVALDVLSISELTRQRKGADIETGFENLELYRNASLLEIGRSNPLRIQLERY
jgi:hypothetical protein